MRAVWNERLQLVFRYILYIILIIFLLRNSIDIYSQFTAAESTEEQQQQQAVSEEVPIGAKSVAEAFLKQWYTVQPNQEQERIRLQMLQSLTTPSFYQYINNSNIIEFNAPTQNQPNQQGQQQQEPTQLVAKEVNIWQATWIDKTIGTASITARLVTSDNRTLFLSVPVVKLGTSWFVDSLPSLIPKPVPQEAETPPSVELETGQKEAIQEMLNSFFGAWLVGNTEATRRYIENPLPTANILEEVKGQFGGVLDVQVLSNEPVKVKATISVKEESGAEVLYHYFVTVLEKNGNWYIQSIQ